MVGPLCGGMFWLALPFSLSLLLSCSPAFLLSCSPALLPPFSPALRRRNDSYGNGCFLGTLLKVHQHLFCGTPEPTHRRRGESSHGYRKAVIIIFFFIILCGSAVRKATIRGQASPASRQLPSFCSIPLGYK